VTARPAILTTPAASSVSDFEAEAVREGALERRS
jgi:hypothetical protein